MNFRMDDNKAKALRKIENKSDRKSACEKLSQLLDT